MSRGFPLSELENWNTGMLIDWALEHDRMQKLSRGDPVYDDYERYQQLKAVEPQIEQLNEQGKIKPKKYQSYKKTLADCERKLR